MKVQVKYTVDIESVPKEVKDRYIMLMRELMSIHDTHRTAQINEENMHQLIDRCHNIRKKLLDIDLGLDDLSAIAKQFMAHKYKMEVTADEAQTNNPE
jgi:hypothetical protein